MSNHICSEIMYIKEGGDPVHSDLCWDELNEEHRKFLHDNLDEWLDKSRGTGIFYVGMLPENKGH